jgi:nucleotide-binding universal stress UspA family protein
VRRPGGITQNLHHAAADNERIALRVHLAPCSGTSTRRVRPRYRRDAPLARSLLYGDTMKPIQKILCPTDFSKGSDVAVQFAAELATRFGAEIELVHVFQLPYYGGWDEGAAVMAAAGPQLAALRKQTSEQMRAQVEKLHKRGLKAKATEVDGLPHQKVAELSKDANLVVMGTHGRTGLPRLLLGSVAERVVRMAQCPVITVPSAE